jgi:hypothetical protein
LTGAKGTGTTAGAALGKKLDLAAVDATAGGKEGTVIWAKRADGRAARTNCSGAAGVLAGIDSTGGVTVSTLVTLMFFALGVWAAGTAWVTADDWLGLTFPVALAAADVTAAVLATAALTGRAGFEVGLALEGVALGFAAVLSAALAIKTLDFAGTALAFAGAALAFAGAALAFAGAALAFAGTALAFVGTALAFAGAVLAFAGAVLAFTGVVLAFAAVLTAALTINTLALANGAAAFLATADLPRGFAFFEVFTSCLLAVSKGRVLTDCPCAADRKPVHVLYKPYL